MTEDGSLDALEWDTEGGTALRRDDVFAPEYPSDEATTEIAVAVEPRFDGDTSSLPPEVCWTLQELVAAPHITERSARHWAVLLRHEPILRSRLCELGLTLQISHEHKFAFTKQADDPSPYARAILRSKTLSVAATALALHLYHQYLVSPDDPIVERADLIDHMMAYQRPTDTDAAGFARKINTALGQLENAAIIRMVKGQPDRFVVHPVITAVLGPEEVDDLRARYEQLAQVDADLEEFDDE